MRQSHHRSTQVWHALSTDHTNLSHTGAFIHEWTEPYLPFAFLVEAGPRLPTQEGWGAEFAELHAADEIAVKLARFAHT